MINLIPPSTKEEIAYGRKNSLMVRWVIGIALALAGLVVIGGGSLFYLKQDSKNYQKSIEEAELSLEQQGEKQVLEKVGEISGSLSLVVDVLSREVLFSKLLPHLGSLMPDGTILRDLSLNREQTGGINLSIGAINEFTASQALINLQNSEEVLFNGADANSINCEGDEKQMPYICTASVTVLLTGENPFLLLNQGAKDE